MYLHKINITRERHMVVLRAHDDNEASKRRSCEQHGRGDACDALDLTHKGDDSLLM